MKFPLVRNLAAEGFPVTVTCGVPGFSTQAFYKWRAPPVSDRDWADAHAFNAIVDIHADNPEFGYRFIADEPDRAGHDFGEGRVHRLFRVQQVWSSTTKKGRRGSGKTPGPADGPRTPPTPVSSHPAMVCPVLRPPAQRAATIRPRHLARSG